MVRVQTQIKTIVHNLLICSSVIGLVLLSSLHHALAAGPASLTLTPASGSYAVGDMVTVRLYVNSGVTQIAAVEADLNYDKNTLQYSGMDTNGTAFEVAAPQTTGGGVIKIARGVSGTAVTGNQFIAALSFRAIAASPASKISYVSSSSISASPNASEAWNGQINSATFALNAPAATPAPSTPSTPTTHSTPTPTSTKSTTEPSHATTPQKTAIASNSGASSAASPTTSTSTPAAAAAPVDPAQDQPVTETQPDSQRLVAIKVVDNNNKPVANAVVTIDGKNTVKTDAQGVASFVGVASGEHKISVTYSGKTTKQSITISQNGAQADGAAVQDFGVKLDHASATSSQPSSVVYGGVVAIVIVALWLVLMPRRRLHVRLAPGTSAPDGIVIGNKAASPPVNATPTDMVQVIHPTNQAPAIPEPPKDLNGPRV